MIGIIDSQGKLFSKVAADDRQAGDQVIIAERGASGQQSILEEQQTVLIEIGEQRRDRSLPGDIGQGVHVETGLSNIGTKKEGT